MKTKRRYMPANIRAGYTAQEAADVIAKSGTNTATGYCVRVSTFDHGRDTNGNGTAHYNVELTCPNGQVCPVFNIVESGRRREQVGYGRGNEAALVALEKLGYQVDTSKASSDDYRGEAVYPLLNFPPMGDATLVSHGGNRWLFKDENNAAIFMSTRKGATSKKVDSSLYTMQFADSVPQYAVKTEV